MGLPIHSAGESAIAKDALRMIAKGALGIYERKKDLEEQMIAHMNSWT